ncbi:MAG: hypothetical protein U0271_40590 [Polyangiaceae bacterium]
MPPSLGPSNQFAALVCVVSLVACAGGAGSASQSERKTPVIRWYLNQGLWGEETLEVQPDGSGHYSFEPTGMTTEPRSVDFHVSESELDEIGALAKRVRFCEEKSDKPSNPDEAKPTLTLALSDAKCEVSLWDTEWAKRSGPRELRNRIRALYK